MIHNEAKKFRYSLIIPALFVLLLWLIGISQEILDIKFSHLGVYPRSLKGMLGILLTPLIHGDLGHLFSNSIPLLFMGTGVIYFYRSLSYKVFAIIWIASGVCIWLAGRPSYHIGASGMVYGLAAFLFFSGAIRRDPRLAAISLMVVFLYGGMIWGIFPIWPNISWEGHLFGGVAGLACAIAYRKQGPQRPVYSWELEPDEDDDEEMDNNGNIDESNRELNAQTKGNTYWISTTSGMN